MKRLDIWSQNAAWIRRLKTPETGYQRKMEEIGQKWVSRAHLVFAGWVDWPINPYLRSQANRDFVADWMKSRQIWSRNTA